LIKIYTSFFINGDNSRLAVTKDVVTIGGQCNPYRVNITVVGVGGGWGRGTVLGEKGKTGN